MAQVGLITNEGREKSITLANEEGFIIMPYRFEVSEQAGVFDKSREITSLMPSWYQGTISSAIKISNDDGVFDTVQFSCNIPAEVSPDPRFTREVYLIAQDENGDDFLLAFAQPSNELTYDPDGELRIRLQVTIDNVDIGNLFQFKYTQATEIEDHNNDLNAHPVIQTALHKNGIFSDTSLLTYVGQNMDTNPSIASNVSNGEVVYFNQNTQRYEKALANSLLADGNAVGVYLANHHVVVYGGIISFPHGEAPYKDVFLSQLSSGQITFNASGLKIGHTLDRDRIFLNFQKYDEEAATDPDGDVSIRLEARNINELVLNSPNGTKYRVSISSLGTLQTEEVFTEETIKFKITKPDLSFAEIKVQDDGLLYIQSPVDDMSVITNDHFYIKDDEGTAWKLTISLLNTVILESYDNTFEVVADNGQVNFNVKQIDRHNAFVGIQAFSDTLLHGNLELAKYLNILSDPSLLYLGGEKIGSYIHLMAKINNGFKHFAGYSVGEIKESMLSLADFQKYYDGTWVLIDGSDVSGSDLDTIFGINTLPNEPMGLGNSNRYMKINF